MSFLPKHLPILMYHQVLPKNNSHFKKHIAIEPQHFEAQLKYMIDQGWNFLTLHEFFADKMNWHRDHLAIISFDDLSSSFVDYALPILTKLGLKASLFPIHHMTTGLPYSNLSHEGISPLSNQDLKMIFDAGHELGSHGQSHQNLRKIPLEQVRVELAESKKWLEEITNAKITSVCYPIGGVDKDIIHVAKDLGYLNGLTTIKGTLQFSQDQMCLRRVDIKNHVIGDQFKRAIGPFYGLRRLLTRPFRAKYRMDLRHPSIK